MAENGAAGAMIGRGFGLAVVGATRKWGQAIEAAYTGALAGGAMGLAMGVAVCTYGLAAPHLGALFGLSGVPAAPGALAGIPALTGAAALAGKVGVGIAAGYLSFAASDLSQSAIYGRPVGEALTSAHEAGMFGAVTGGAMPLVGAGLRLGGRGIARVGQFAERKWLYLKHRPLIRELVGAKLSPYRTGIVIGPAGMKQEPIYRKMAEISRALRGKELSLDLTHLGTKLTVGGRTGVRFRGLEFSGIFKEIRLETLAHVHPSGRFVLSAADLEVLRQLGQAGTRIIAPSGEFRYVEDPDYAVYRAWENMAGGI